MAGIGSAFVHLQYFCQYPVLCTEWMYEWMYVGINRLLAIVASKQVSLSDGFF